MYLSVVTFWFELHALTRRSGAATAQAGVAVTLARASAVMCPSAAATGLHVVTTVAICGTLLR